MIYFRLVNEKCEKRKGTRKYYGTRINFLQSTLHGRKIASFIWQTFSTESSVNISRSFSLTMRRRNFKNTIYIELETALVPCQRAKHPAFSLLSPSTSLLSRKRI